MRKVKESMLNFLLAPLCFSVFLTALEAQARIYNYQDIPVGERNVGMGTACMAVAGDVGNMYYNPAVLAWAEGRQVTAALTSYNRYDSRTGTHVSLFESAIDNMTRGGFMAIPAMVGGLIDIKGWIWGGAMIVPNSYQNSGSAKISDTQVAAFDSSSEAIWIGSFLSKRLNAKHALGVSVFYVSPSISERLFFVETPSPTSINLRLIDRSFSYNGLIMILGGAYDINSRWNMGYSFRTPLWRLGSQATYQYADSNDVTKTRYEEFEIRVTPMPLRLSAGTAWQPDEDWLLAADVHYYGAFSGAMDGGLGLESFEINAKPIFNFSLGAEYFLKPGLQFRAGVFTNNSSAKDLKGYPTALDDKVNMLGGTGAVVLREPSGTLTIGGYIQMGQGESVGIGEESTTMVPRNNYFYGIIVGSNYKF